MDDHMSMVQEIPTILLIQELCRRLDDDVQVDFDELIDTPVETLVPIGCHKFSSVIFAGMHKSGGHISESYRLYGADRYQPDLVYLAHETVRYVDFTYQEQLDELTVDDEDDDTQ